LTCLRSSAAGLAAALLAAAGAVAQPQGDVIASSLGEIDPLLIGVRRDPAQFGPSALGQDQWYGSDLQSIADAASRAPAESGSLAASELAALVLETPGRSPEGAGDPVETTRARAAALLELGRVDAVDMILTQTPGALADPARAALAVNARLVKDDKDAACGIANGLARGREAPFWIRLRVACLIWSGDDATAELTLDLMAERAGELADEAFATWARAAQNERAPSDPPAPRDAIEASLARTAEYDYAVEDVEQAPFLVALIAALDTNAGAEARATAAERAALNAALGPVELSDILNIAAPSDGRSPAELIEAGRADPTALGDALLRRAARAPNPATAAEALAADLGRQSSPAAFVVEARLAHDALVAVPPSRELIGIAPTLALGAAAAGEVELAYAWLDPRADEQAASRRGAFANVFGGPPGAPDLSSSPLEPVIRTAAEAVVAAADPAATPRRLAEVAEARLATTMNSGEALRAEARRDVLILLALGAESSPALRRAADAALIEAAPPGAEAEQSVRTARLAAQAGAIGEAALRSASAAAAAGPGHAPTYAAVIEITRALGLSADARAFAVEAMLASRVGDPDAAFR
jgi:hypothetical protein